MAHDESEAMGPSAVVAAMLYGAPEHSPEQRLFPSEQLLLIRRFNLVELVHLGRDALIACTVDKEYAAAEAETHQQALLAEETAAGLVSMAKVRLALRWRDMRFIRFEKRTITASDGAQAELRIDLQRTDPDPTREGCPAAIDDVADWFGAHLPEFASVDAKLSRLQILKDGGCLTVFSVLVAALMVALGNLLAQIEWLAGLAPYLIDGGGVVFALLMLLTVFGTGLGLWSPETVVELRPKAADAPYR